MSLAGFLRVWLALFALENLLTLAFVPPPRLRTVMASEIAESRRVLGDEATERAVRGARESFKAVVRAMPFLEARDESESPIRPARRGFDRVLERGQALVELALYRASVQGGFLIPILAIITAAAIDGLAMRRRRAFSFATTSTAVYNTASYLVLSTLVLPLLYLAAAVPVSPAFFPIIGIAAAGAVWVFLAHLPGAAPIIRSRG